MHPRVLVFLLAPLVAGCSFSSTHARSQLTLQPGARLLVHADGERPTVRVTVRGDGALEYTWKTSDGSVEGGVVRHGSIGNRTDDGCELVGVVVNGEIEATVEVRNGRGVRIESDTAAAAASPGSERR